jgi:hypothetical protein
VSWPGGEKEVFTSLPANHLYVLRETEGIVGRERFG